MQSLYARLEQVHTLKNNVIIDDRINLTIGRRFLEAKKTGYPYIIALGKKITESPSQLEVTNLQTDEQLHLEESALLDYVSPKETCAVDRLAFLRSSTPI